MRKDLARNETEKLEKKFQKTLKSFGGFKKAITFVAPNEGNSSDEKRERLRRLISSVK